MFLRTGADFIRCKKSIQYLVHIYMYTEISDYKTKPMFCISILLERGVPSGISLQWSTVALISPGLFPHRSISIHTQEPVIHSIQGTEVNVASSTNSCSTPSCS